MGGFRLPRQFVSIAESTNGLLTDMFVYPDLTLGADSNGLEPETYHPDPTVTADADVASPPPPPTPALFVWPIVWVVEGLVGALAGGTDNIEQLTVALETLTILCKGTRSCGFNLIFNCFLKLNSRMITRSTLLDALL